MGNVPAAIAFPKLEMIGQNVAHQFNGAISMKMSQKIVCFGAKADDFGADEVMRRNGFDCWRISPRQRFECAK